MIDFTLRAFQKSDLDDLVKCANNQNIADNLMDRYPYPYTVEDGKEFILFATSKNPLEIKAIEINGKVNGALGLHPGVDIYCKNAELGYWLAEPFWGKGIMSRAIPKIVEYGFQNFDIDRIFARPFGTNLASQRVLEKSGFILEGRFANTLYKNGRYEDELIYAMRRSHERQD
jgi:RimJ/RimL family protein N-acetyltransferase